MSTCEVNGITYDAVNVPGGCKGCAAETDVACVPGSLCIEFPECYGIVWVRCDELTPLQHYHAALEQEVG